MEPQIRKETPAERRVRLLARLEGERAALALDWVALETSLYVQERRVVGITRGFRAVMPFGAAAGALWLLHRFGPAGLARRAMMGMTVWRALRRFIPLGISLSQRLRSTS